MELESELYKRAQGSLFNPTEVSREVVSLALREARELTGHKKIPSPSLLDLAMLRLKLLLKVEPSALDEELARNALKSAQNLKDTDVGMYSYGMRSSIFGRSE